MGDTWVTDLRHLLRDDGDAVSSPGGRVAQYLCQIVAAVTEQASDGLRETSLACRRQPGHHPCPGRVRAGFDEGTDMIRWLCPSCGDNGWISEWQRTRWDKGGRVGLPSIQRVTYRGGFVRKLSERDSLPVVILEDNTIPREVVVAIHDNNLIGVAGQFGDPAVGVPIQYEELTIEHPGGADTMIVFNRAIMLFHTRDDLLVRFHRVACLIDDIGRPNKRLERT